MPEISTSSKLRLANKLDISNLSVSMPTIRPDKSRLSKSRLNNFETAPEADLTKSESPTASIISDTLISDKS